MEHIWVESKKHSPLPPFAVFGGHDCDGSTMYVGRSYHKGNCLPAKVIPSKDTAYAYVCWDGCELIKNDFEVLTGHHYRWTECVAGLMPSNAVPAGNTVSGEPLYIGRGFWKGSLTLGQINPSHNVLYISFDGEEHCLDSYEVLTFDMNNNNFYECSIQ